MSQMTSASEMPCRRATSATSFQGSSASGSSSQRARSSASTAPLSAGPRCSSERSSALRTSSCLSLKRTTHIRNLHGARWDAGCSWKLGRGADGTADPDRLDAVLAHRLDPDRVAVGLDRVAPLGQAPERGEDVAADRVVGVAVDRQLDLGVGEVAERDVTAHEPVAVGELAQGGGAGIGLILDLPHHLLEDVLDGDDPDRAAVLVDDDRERGALDLKVVEEVVERARLRNDQGVANDRIDRRLGALAHVDAGEAVVVDDPFDAIGV